MGLDYTELVIGIEDATGVSIPDDVAATLATPRQLIAYLHSQLPQQPFNPCLSQRAFYVLRSVLAERLGLRQDAMRPSTELRPLLALDGRRAFWEDVGAKLAVPPWPWIQSKSWFARIFPPWEPGTLGEAATYVSGSAPRAVKPAAEGWSWHELETILAWQFDYHLDIRGYSLDDRFVEDIGFS